MFYKSFSHMKKEVLAMFSNSHCNGCFEYWVKQWFKQLTISQILLDLSVVPHFIYPILFESLFSSSSFDSTIPIKQID